MPIKAQKTEKAGDCSNGALTGNRVLSFFDFRSINRPAVMYMKQHRKYIFDPGSVTK